MSLPPSHSVQHRVGGGSPSSSILVQGGGASGCCRSDWPWPGFGLETTVSAPPFSSPSLPLHLLTHCFFSQRLSPTPRSVSLLPGFGPALVQGMEPMVASAPASNHFCMAGLGLEQPQVLCPRLEVGPNKRASNGTVGRGQVVGIDSRNIRTAIYWVSM